MDDAALGRVEDAEGERAAVLSDLIGGKACHRVKLGLAGLPKPLGVDDESMLAVELAAINLEKHDLKSIEQFAVLGQCEMRILAAEVQHAAFVGPFGRKRSDQNPGPRPGPKGTLSRFHRFRS